jgi:hypothetical protein
MAAPVGVSTSHLPMVTTRRRGRHTGAVTSPPPGLGAARGVVRLLNTADGRVLCLAGVVDDGAVTAFHRWYGREPARVDAIDAGSVTSLSGHGLELLLDHLTTAGRAGRTVRLRPSRAVARPLAAWPTLPW